MGRTTAYFLFMSENRASVRETLQAAGTPTDVGNVGKALGARWKALSDDERKVAVPVDGC